MDEKQLLAARQAEIDAAKAIRDKAKAENRDLTDEELAAVEGHLAKAEELKGKIEAAREATRKRQEALARLQAQEDWTRQAQPARAPAVNPQDGMRGPGDQGNAAGSANRIDPIGGEGSGRWSCFGEFLNRVKRAGIGGGLDDRLLVLSPRDRVSADQLREMGPLAAASGMGVAVDSDGGYLIPTEFRDALVRQVFETGALVGRVQRASLTGNSLKIPYVDETSRATGSRFGGVQGYWVDEGTNPGDTKPKFGSMSFGLKKCAAVGYITEEMIADYGASSTLMMNAFRDELVWLVENAIVNGTGAGQPYGILSAGCLVSIAKEDSQVAATIWGQNIVKMWARMPASSRANAIWLINQDCEPQLWSLGLLSYGGASTSDVIPLYFPSGSLLNQGQYGNLMGRPVIPVEYCQTLGTKGDIFLIDPTQYLLVDKAGGIQAASSIHVRFLYDEQTFRVTYRVDGQPLWRSAITPANGSNSLSPFISLDTRS